MKSFRPLLLILILLVFSGVGFSQGTPGTVRFPSNPDTPDSLFRVKDAPTARLTGTVTAGATTLVVDTTATFDSSGSLKIDNEVIFYTSKTSTTFTGLTRGASGTVAATHTAGTLVRSPILAVHHNTLAQAIINTQTKLGSSSSTPIAGSVLFGTGVGTSAWNTQPALDCSNCFNIPGGGAGGGDVSGPASAINDEMVLFSGSTGKIIKRSNTFTGYVKLSSGVVSAAPIPEADLPTITNSKLAAMATSTFKGRISSGSGPPEDLTATQATSLLNIFTTTLKGLVPPSGTASGTNFLRDDGIWAAPPGGGGGSGDMVLASAQTVTGAKTFDPAKLIVGNTGTPPTPALGAFYVNSSNGKPFFGINGTTWGEFMVAGKSLINLGLHGSDPAASNVTGVLPLAGGGTNQALWTANRCVRVNSGGTGLESATVDCGSGGGGSGTINSGTANQVAVYSAPTAVSGNTGFTYNPTTGELLIGETGDVGYILTGRLVTAKTIAYTVGVEDKHVFFTNTGASAGVTFTLPTPTIGLQYEFYRDANQTVTIDVAGSVTIRAGANVTTTGGNVTLDAVGSRIRIVAISATQWVGDITGTVTFN